MTHSSRSSSLNSLGSLDVKIDMDESRTSSINHTYICSKIEDLLVIMQNMNQKLLDLSDQILDLRFKIDELARAQGSCGAPPAGITYD